MPHPLHASHRHRRDISASERLHTHIHRRLLGWPSDLVDIALEAADAAFADGAGHMQSALDAGLDAAIAAGRAQAAA